LVWAGKGRKSKRAFKQAFKQAFKMNKKKWFINGLNGIKKGIE
jgi:hypothetical protein